MISIKALVACEESQRVTLALRKLGVSAYSCDVKPTSGPRPSWHLQGDALKVLHSSSWDLLIAFPPCTYMSRAGARWMHPGGKPNVCSARYAKALEARRFFMALLEADVPHVAVENPTPLKIVGLPAPTQAIQPYEFGHPYSKRTLLWLRNLPRLKPTEYVANYKPFLPSNTGAGKRKGQVWSRGVAYNSTDASKTFEGVANAMAAQWTSYIRKLPQRAEGSPGPRPTKESQ